MSLPFFETFTGGAAVLANPPWTQAALSARTLNVDGSGSGKASAIDAGFDIIAYDNSNTYSADQYAQVVIAGGLQSANNWAEVFVRCSGSGGTFAGYQFITDGAVGGGAAHTELWYYSGGVATLLRNFAVTFVTNDVMRIEVSGTTITCYQNGVSIGTQVDSHVAGPGAGGAGVFNTSSNNVLLDTFESGNLSASPFVEIRTNRRRGNPANKIQSRKDTGQSIFADQIYPVPPIVIPIPPPNARLLKFAQRRRRGRGAIVTRIAALLASFAVNAPKPLVVSAKRRRKHGGSVTQVRRKGVSAAPPAVVPKRPSIVKPKQHRRLRERVNIVAGARRNLLRPPKVITVVQSKKRRHRTNATNFVSGARRATVRPAQPYTVLASKRRNRLRQPFFIKRQGTVVAPPVRRAPTLIFQRSKRRRAGRGGSVTSMMGALYFTIFPRSEPITQVQPKRRHKKQAKITIVTGARRAPVVINAIRPRNPQITVQPKKRHRRGGAVNFLAARLVSYARKNTVPTLVQSKKRRKRGGHVTIAQARRVPIVLNAIRPRNPVISVQPKKRRKRSGDVIISTGARRVAAVVNSIRPRAPQIVKAKKKRVRMGAVTFIAGALFIPVVAAKPAKPNIARIAGKRKLRRGVALFRRGRIAPPPAIRPRKPRVTVFGRLKRRIVRLHGRYGIQPKTVPATTDMHVHVLRDVRDLSQTVEVRVIDLAPTIYDRSHAPFIHSVVTDAIAHFIVVPQVTSVLVLDPDVIKILNDSSFLDES